MFGPCRALPENDRESGAGPSSQSPGGGATEGKTKTPKGPQGNGDDDDDDDDNEEKLAFLKFETLIGTIVASAGVTGTIAVVLSLLFRVDVYGHFNALDVDAGKLGMIYFLPVFLWTAFIFVPSHDENTTMRTYKEIQCRNNPAIGFSYPEELLIIVLIELADNMLNRAVILGGGGQWLSDRLSDAGYLAFDTTLGDDAPIWLGLSATQVAQAFVLTCAAGWKVGTELRTNQMRNDLLDRMAEALRKQPDLLGKDKDTAKVFKSFGDDKSKEEEEKEVVPTTSGSDDQETEVEIGEDGLPLPVRPLTKLQYQDAQEIIQFRRRVDAASSLDAVADTLKILSCGASYIATQNLFAPYVACCVGQILYSIGQRSGLDESLGLLSDRAYLKATMSDNPNPFDNESSATTSTSDDPAADFKRKTMAKLKADMDAKNAEKKRDEDGE